MTIAPVSDPSMQVFFQPVQISIPIRLPRNFLSGPVVLYGKVGVM